MLYDYQSLIYVEKDNYIAEPDFEGDEDGGGAHFYHYGNYKADANIKIINCRIIDSSFS